MDMVSASQQQQQQPLLLHHHDEPPQKGLDGRCSSGPATADPGCARCAGWRHELLGFGVLLLVGAVMGLALPKNPKPDVPLGRRARRHEDAAFQTSLPPPVPSPPRGVPGGGAGCRAGHTARVAFLLVLFELRKAVHLDRQIRATIFLELYTEEHNRLEHSQRAL